MIYFYLMFISGHEHYLRLKVLRRYFQYISLGQPVCFALIKDGGKNHESAYTGKVLVGLPPVGFPRFVSDAFPCSISDDDISAQSGILSLARENKR